MSTINWTLEKYLLSNKLGVVMRFIKFICLISFLIISHISCLFSQRATFWEPASPLPDPNVWALAHNSVGHIFAATQTGIYKSTNNGDTWVLASSDLAALNIPCLAIKPSNSYMFAGTYSDGLFRSTDDGSTWQQVNSMMAVRSIAFSPDGKIFAATFGYNLYRSSDDGTTWTQLATGLPMAYLLAVNASSNRVYIGTTGAGVAYSTDMGNNFSLPSNFYSTTVDGIAINTSGNIFAATYYDGILKSTDQGLTWTQANNGLVAQDYSIRSIISTADGKLYAGTFYTGVFRSTDDGSSWNKISSGLKSWNIPALMEKTDGRIFCGTNGAGVFRSVIHTRPVFNIDKDTIIFTSLKNGVTTPLVYNIYISNIGIGTFNWTVVTKPVWLNLTPTGGSDVGTITSTVNNSSFPPGEQQAYIIYNAPGADNSPDSTLAILKIYDPAIKVTPPDSLWFGNVNVNTSKDLPLTVSNEGNDTLSISSLQISGGDNAVFTKAGGENSINIPSGESYSFNIRFRPTSVGYKYSYYSITYNAEGSPYHVKLSGNGQGPTIVVDKDTLWFFAERGGPLPVSQSFQVSNGSGGILNWSISDDQAWIDVTPTIDGMQNELRNVNINTTNLTAGQYIGTITISSTNAINSPRKIIVIYKFTQGPKITVNPLVLNFSAIQNGLIPPSKTFDVTNAGSGNLNWTLVLKKNSIWLSFNPTIGTDSTKITVTILTSNLLSGTYTDTILISSANAGNNPQKVVITYTILPGTAIAINPNLLNFTALQNGLRPQDQSFSITNSGGGVLDWALSIKGGSTWLGLDKMSGTENGSVKVGILSTNLAPGIYRDTIHINSNAAVNSPQFITVLYTVTPVTGIRKENIPAQYSLSQNYPNPFNPSTRIDYSIPENSHVTIKVFDTFGRVVAGLTDRYHNAGIYSIDWIPENIPSGVYYYKISAGRYNEIRKALYIR